MITIVLLLVMTSIPLLLLQAARKRARKETGWKMYAVLAGVLMIGMVVAKILNVI
ncbi:hypothetical protein [Azotosporobacter soli]|uniref:hypothetical protein n=1 Tax=Azotosporobacter soli TaxID=3055040 RepID=UPI0031FEC862